MKTRTKRLIKKARCGDSVAFAELFQEHVPILWAKSLQILRNEQDASDALQDAAVKAWIAIPNFNMQSSIGTWLTRILLNSCYDILRERKCETLIDATKEDQLQNLISNDDLNHTRLSINETLNKLNHDDRNILALFYFADLTLKDIASMLGINENAAKVRLYRARDRFRNFYFAE